MANKIVQVPMDENLIGALDSLSKKRGLSRAEVVREACKQYLEGVEEEALVELYEEGYARIPEDPMMGQGQVAIVGQVLAEEKW